MAKQFSYYFYHLCERGDFIETKFGSKEEFGEYMEYWDLLDYQRPESKCVEGEVEVGRLDDWLVGRSDNEKEIKDLYIKVVNGEY